MKTLLWYRAQNIAVAVCLGLALALALADDGFAQSTPGIRMRPPAADPRIRLGGPGGPPRLTGMPARSFNRGRFRHHFFSPFQYFGAYPFGFYGNAYGDDSVGDYSADSAPARVIDPADYTTDVKPAPSVQQLDDSAAVGKLQVTTETSGSKTLLRLSLRGSAGGASQVAFFLADSARAVLSAQTVRNPPFTTVFEPPPRTAFAGMTVVLPGGTLVTQFSPYRGRAR
jgi:hypothetical protein